MTPHTKHHHHARTSQAQESGHVDYLSLFPASHSGVTPLYPVRISLDQHHSVKKQGRRHTSIHNHLRPTALRNPAARAAVRTWIAHRHEEHILKENTNHT